MMEDMGMGSESGRKEIAGPSQVFFAKAVADGTYYGCLAVDDTNTVIAGGGVLLSHWPPSPLDGSTQRAYIINMYTEPGYRRRGLARKILNHLLAYCHERRITTLRLNASEMGRTVYASAGFTDSNEMVLSLQEAA